MSDQTTSPVILTGFMGAGKTLLARRWSQAQNWVNLDLDEMITTRSGQTPGEIIRVQGEETFREIERRSLEEVLVAGEVDIISLGGGAWLEEANRALISRFGGVTVWVDTPFDICWERIKDDVTRPLARSERAARQLYNLRRRTYALASVRVGGLFSE